jgi:hypothetical protein
MGGGGGSDSGGGDCVNGRGIGGGGGIPRLAIPGNQCVLGPLKVYCCVAISRSLVCNFPRAQTIQKIGQPMNGSKPKHQNNMQPIGAISTQRIVLAAAWLSFLHVNPNHMPAQITAVTSRANITR